MNILLILGGRQNAAYQGGHRLLSIANEIRRKKAIRLQISGLWNPPQNHIQHKARKNCNARDTCKICLHPGL